MWSEWLREGRVDVVMAEEEFVLWWEKAVGAGKDWRNCEFS